MTTTVPGPSALLFECEIVSGEFRDLVERTAAYAQSVGLPAVSGWRTRHDQRRQATDFAAELQRLPGSAGDIAGKSSFIHFDFSGEGFATADFFPELHGSGLVRLSLNKATDRSGREGLLRFQQQCFRILALHFAGSHVYSAQITALGGGALCIPDVPLVTTNSHIAVTNSQEVDERYDDPAAFWNAGWSIAAERAGQRLLTREMDLLVGPEYLERIIDHQWAMARAAKAGETGYDDPEILPEEDAIFRGGPARLEFVGYSPSEKQIEYSCVLGEGQHIQGWEVYALRRIINTRKTPDGKAPVKMVRVVFMKEWMAQSEKRPLLDIGCRLFYYDAAGELRDLAD